jgi:uncharacterized membrane protein YcjF (UPF0283 family)
MRKFNYTRFGEDFIVALVIFAISIVVGGLWFILYGFDISTWIDWTFMMVWGFATIIIVGYLIVGLTKVYNRYFEEP